MASADHRTGAGRHRSCRVRTTAGPPRPEARRARTFPSRRGPRRLAGRCRDPRLPPIVNSRSGWEGWHPRRRSPPPLRRPPSPQGQWTKSSAAAARRCRRRRPRAAKRSVESSSNLVPRSEREEQSTQLRIEGGGLGGGDSASQLREQLDGPDAVADLEGSESFRGHSRLSERGLKIALSRNPEGQSPAAQTAVNRPGSTFEEKGAQG